MEQFYEAPAGDSPGQNHWDDGSHYWARVCGLACSRNHVKALQCLLEFFYPIVAEVGSSRSEPRRIQSQSWREPPTLFEVIAKEGLQRNVYNDNSKLDFTPHILEQLRSHCLDTELLATRSEQGSNLLDLALRNGDSTLSVLFITWVGPASMSKLVLSDKGKNLLDAACQGELLILARYFARSGAKFTKAHLDANILHLYKICSDKHIPEEEAVEWVEFLHEQGEDLFASRPDLRTPLHLAAADNKVAVVRYVIQNTHNRQQRHPKDESGKTPLMLAHDNDVKQEFAPWQPNSDGMTPTDVRKSYRAIITQWYQSSRSVGVIKRDSGIYPVHDCLYEKHSYGNWKKPFRGDRDRLRWIHLPVNNIEWCEDLLLRWYLEGDGHCEDVNLEAIQQAFDQQHVSRTRQSRFIRPGAHCSHLSNHIIFVAVPYMDFETSSNREQMQNTLGSLDESTKSTSMIADETLYAKYIDDPAFHPRRTLDQYVYYNTDTSQRDADQVVQRYQQNHADWPSVDLVNGPDLCPPSILRRAQDTPM